MRVPSTGSSVATGKAGDVSGIDVMSGIMEVITGEERSIEMVSTFAGECAKIDCCIEYVSEHGRSYLECKE